MIMVEQFAISDQQQQQQQEQDEDAYIFTEQDLDAYIFTEQTFMHHFESKAAAIAFDIPKHIQTFNSDPEAFRILVVLRSGERHGYALVKELESDPGRPGRVLPANLYRRIRTLLAQGLIAESEQRPDHELDDQRRRYFRITDSGEAVARAEAARLDALLAGARDLLRP